MKLPLYKYCPLCQCWKVSRRKDGGGKDFYIDFSRGSGTGNQAVIPVCLECRLYIVRPACEQCKKWIWKAINNSKKN